MKRFHELIQKHLDQVATAAELAELDRCLVAEPGTAAAFVVAGRIDADLAAHFDNQGRIHALEFLRGDLFSRSRGALADQASTVEAARACRAGGRRWAPPRWLAAAVVLLTLAGTFMYWHSQSARAAAEVLSGRVLVNGIPAEHIPDGAHFEVAGDAAAVIRLPSGTHAELTPASEAVFSKRVLELKQGGGKFHIGKNGRRFRVETPAGNVTATDTEFSLELRPEDEEGSESMNPKLTVALVVAVTLGQVEVDCGGQKRVLSLGESRVFAADKPDGGKKNVLSGKVAEVAADGKSFTVEGQSAKAAAKPARTEVKVTDKTEIVYFGFEQGADRPTVGCEVAVAFADGSPDTAERVTFGPKQPHLGGHVKAVAEDGRRLSLEIFNKNGPATTAEIQLTDRTRLGYAGIGKDDEKKPTVGYSAQVWLVKDSKDTAAEVQFFNKKGTKDTAAEPLLSGRIAAVAADGSSITLELPSKVKGEGPNKVTFKITAETKLLPNSGDKADKPAAGQVAAITLVKGTQDTVAAVKFGAGKEGANPKESGAEPQLVGPIAAVAADGAEITLEVPSKIKGEEAKKISIKIMAETKLVSTTGDKSAKPAVGQTAMVWLVKESKDTAAAVQFGPPRDKTEPKPPIKKEPPKPNPDPKNPKPGVEPKKEKPDLKDNKPLASGPIDAGNVERVRATAAAIDAEIDRRLADAKVPASTRSDDAEFLRRVFLDIIGRLPTYGQAVAFLDSTDPDKRSKLINELLASSAYGQHFGIIWKNRIVPRDTSSVKYGIDRFSPWLAEQFNANRGWDRMVYDLLTVEGVIAQNPQTSFIMANSEGQQPQPTLLADATTKLFLGVQLQCAQCHNHPFAAWKQTDYWSTAAFFSRVRNTNNKGQRDASLTEATGGEEARPAAPKGEKASAAAPFGSIVIPSSGGKGAGQVVKARFLRGDEPMLTENEPLRPRFATWATAAENPYFAPATANRLWAHFFGRGLVNPVDNIHEDNPASHPELLKRLADELRAGGFDQKHLIRCICNSAAYQRSSRPLPANEADQELFSHLAVKVMSPDVLCDALAQVMAPPTGGKPEARDPFLNFFSVPPDTTPVEFSQGIPQLLRLMNGSQLNQRSQIIEQLSATGWDTEKVVEGLYLVTLSRRPSAEEAQVMKDYLAKRTDPKEGYAGVLWILLNSSEFIVNH